MSINIADDEPLIRDGVDSGEDSRNWKCCGRKKKRDDLEGDDLLLNTSGCGLWSRLKRVQWFWAEIVLFLYMFCDFPITFVNQKYTLEWITVYNWRQDLHNNITHDFNITGGDSIDICNANTSSPEYEFNQRSQRMTSYFGMLRMGVWVFPAMFSTLILGSVSDKHGRMWAFMPPVFGNFVTTTAGIFIIYFKGSILWLLILDFASGLSGSFGCVFMAGVAHVIGKTTVDTRLLRLTVLQLFISAGSTISPFGMGLAYAVLGPTMTLIITAGFTAINLLYCMICIPAMKNSVNSGLVIESENYSEHKMYSVDEPSRPPDPSEDLQPPMDVVTDNVEHGLIHRRAGQGNQSSDNNEGLSNESGVFRQISIHVKNTCGIYSNQDSQKSKQGSPPNQPNPPSNDLASSLLASFSEYAQSQSIYLSAEPCQSKMEAVCRLRILLCAFLVVITAYFDVIVMTLFMLNSPLCWDSSTIGLYTGVFISVAAVGSLILAPVMERYSSHITVAILCCLTSASYRIYLFFVKTTNQMFYGVALNLLNMLLIPSVRTMMTLLVEPGRHGAVLGSISAVEILCCFLGSIIFSIVYSATLLYSTATVFLVSASLYAFGGLIFTGYRIRYGTGSLVAPGSMQEILA